MADEPVPPQLTTFESFRPTLHRAAWAFMAIVVGASILFGVLSQLHDLPSYHWHFAPGWLALSILCFVLFEASHMELWRRILVALHGRISAPRAWAIWAVSLLARYVPTQLLMVVARCALSEREGVPRRICLASIAYEGIFAVSSAVAVSMGFVIGYWHTPVRWAALLVPLGLLLALHPRVFGRVAHIALRRFGSEPLPETLPFGRVLLIAAGYVVSFVVAGLGVYAFARSLHPIAPHHIPLLVTAFAVGYTGAAVAFFVPGGLGVREGGMVSVLDTVLPFSTALAAAIGVRLVQTALELIYAGLAELAARRFEATDIRKASASARESGVPIS